MLKIALGVACGLVTLGAALVYIPAGLVVGGVLLGAVALFADDGR